MASTIEACIEALNVLYRNPDKQARESADDWLKQFRKLSDAWATSQHLLFEPSAPQEAKLFAAQTFRDKIVWDLDEIPADQRLALRDSLLSAFRTFAPGPRVILRQVCIALADLCLQLTDDEWRDPVAAMIDEYGSQPAYAGALLDWLQVLAEEFNWNVNVRVVRRFGRPRPEEQHNGGAAPAVSAEAQQLVQLLAMYLQAQGVTGALQAQCFQCLQAWLRTGQAQPIMLSGTPLLSIIFAALTRDELVDYAVDVLVALIHETQELDDNTAIIQEIVQKLAELRPHLREAISDGNDDRVLGYCRAYVEAGEWYAPLIVKHADFFGPLVEAVADCCTVDELEIVDITVNFWHRLAVAIRKEQRSMQGTDLDALLQVYQQLLTTIIRHLHYPEDSTALVGQARDDFRSFRHSIGDTLKGACSVLGATVGLQRAHDLIQTAVASPSPRWQDVEAPLFAMRSMGAEVDPRDDEIMPAIMDLVLSLPSHPKIRYAATLVVGRYSEWVSNHPEFLERIVGFVLAGFESGERDVVAAAASTLRYLAYDCRSHLVQHLSQLHGVVQTISPRLGLEDRRDLGTALACIITAMPPHDIAAALRLLCEPHIAVIQSVAGTAAGAADLNGAIEALDMLDNLLQTVGPVEHLPNECLATCDQVWQLIHQLLQKHGDNDTIAENSCRVLRRGLDFFGSSARAVAPAVLDGLSGVFEVFPKSGFLWITGKVSITFGHEPDVLPVVQRAIGRETARVVALLQATADTQHISDILEDYTRLIHATVRHLPPVILLSDTFAPAFQIVLAALASLSLTIRDGALDVVHMILDHECLSGAQQGYSVPPELQAQYASFAQAIQAVVGPQVAALSASLVPGMIAWDDEASDHALVIVRVLTRNFAEQFTAALPAALERVDARFVSADDKTRFLQRYQEGLSNPQGPKMREALTWLLRTSRRSTERARMSERAPLE